MLKKSGILLSSYGSIHCTYNVHPTSSYSPSPTSSLRRRSRPRSIKSQRQRPQCRNFADVRPDIPPEEPDLSWPTHSSRLPTPYQIFRLKKGAPYNKQRFYELVKIYHPDKHHCSTSSSPDKTTSSRNSNSPISPTLPNSHLHPTPCTHSSSAERLSPATKIERYRLIIAANAILSDPTARRAYDSHGLGWGETPELQHWRPHSRHRTHYTHHQRDPWAGFAEDSSPFRNATWEDWEKWYQRHDPRPRPRPRFFSNGGFAAVIILCSVLGGMSEISRSREYTGRFLGQLEEIHEQGSRDLEMRRRESQSVTDSQARVQRFLRTKELGARALPEPGGWGNGEDST